MPFCFTEQRATMWSCVWNSERAIYVNIQIIRINTCIPERLMACRESSFPQSQGTSVGELVK